MLPVRETQRRVRFVDDGGFEELVGDATHIDLEGLPEEARWSFTSAVEPHLGPGFDPLLGDAILSIADIKRLDGGKYEACVRFRQTM